MNIITSIAEMKKISKDLKKSSRQISFIPTMGKLHDGHLNLIEEGKKYGEVVVSIFVNPVQFGPDEDFENYPRDFENDVKILKDLNIGYLFHPQADIIKNTATFLINPEYSNRLEGVFRPTHFQGVLTIVMKLFCIINPDFAFFGLKDYQQYILIKKMVEDYFLDVKVIPVPTVREKCGLAMSSRNAYLDEKDKKIACNFYQSLKKTADLFNAGEISGEKLTVSAIKELIKGGFKIDYAKIMDQGLNIEKQSVNSGDILLAAARFKGIRLIDNIFFE
ncbi:MAG: pantoate--beta-alanine ligase [Deltaproteobacteria bacterium]|nr:pantoate--beta-alanine ligase [Deltaproteobacteria bacterium]